MPLNYSKSLHLAGCEFPGRDDNDHDKDDDGDNDDIVDDDDDDDDDDDLSSLKEMYSFMCKL